MRPSRAPTCVTRWRRRSAPGLNLGAMAPDLDALLHAAVQGVGGVERPGRRDGRRPSRPRSRPASTCWCRPAPAPASRWPTSSRAVAHAVATGKPVVVATATLALQAQIVDRDLPRLVEARRAAARPPADVRAGQGPAQLRVPAQARRRLPRRRRGTLFAGRRRSHRRRRRRPRLGAARSSGCASGPTRPTSGDRDELVPGVSERAWRQVSVSAHECLGAQVPDGQRVLRRAGPRRAPRTPTSWSPTTRCWRSTPSRAARCCPSTTSWSSTRRTSWSTGSPRRHRRAHARRWSSAAAQRRAARLADDRGRLDRRRGAARGRPRRGRPRAGCRRPARRRSSTALARVRDAARAVLTELKPASRRGRRRRPAGRPGRASTRCFENVASGCCRAARATTWSGSADEPAARLGAATSRR